MKITWSIKKLREALAGLIFLIFAVAFFIQKQYWLAFLSICLIFALLRLDDLKEIAFSLRDGLFSAKYNTPKEKINEDIKENKQPVTKQNFTHFRNVEAKILADLQKKYDGEMKTLIHFVYGWPGKPEFRYTPDGTLQTTDTLYFFEIKYVLKPEFAKRIVENTIKYLSDVYSKFAPSTGKKLVIKLILASSHDLSQMSFDIPKGIEIEFYKV